MEFKVRTKKLKGTSQEINGCARQLMSAESKIDSVINRLDVGSSTGAIIKNLKSNKEKLTFLSAATSGIERNLKAIAFEYEKTESLIKNQQNIKRYKDAIKRAREAVERAKETVDTVYKKGKNWYNKYVGDPVNLDSGNFIHEVKDLEIKGGDGFTFSRIYNSLSGEIGVFGKGWTHSFEKKIVLEMNCAVVFWEDGRHIVFNRNNGRFTLASGGTGTLCEVSGGYVFATEDELYIFDEAGRYIRCENENGDAFSLEYERDLLIKVVRDSGEFFSLTYDTEKGDKITAVTDHAGRTVSYKYRDNELDTVVCGDHISAYEYDALGRVVGIINPEGIRIIHNEYDAEGRVIKQEFPDGSAMSYSFDDENNVTTLKERNGSESYHYHDDLSRNTENVYENGTESYEYNANNQITYEKDRNGNETRYQYDDRGNVTRMVLANGTVINITYEKHNKPASISINGDRVQKNVYNECGKLIETVDALGRRTSMKYNEKGLPIEVRSPSGNTTEVTYDDRNNIVSVKDEQGVIYFYEYDELNRISASVDGKNNRSLFKYDRYGNLIGITDAIGNTRSYEYNRSNKVTAMKDFNGAMTSISYNELGFPCRMTDPMGHVTELTYNSMWNVASETLPNGGVRNIEYDENNMPIKEADPLGNTKEYEYDSNGNLIAVYDAAGGVTEYKYDQMDQLILVKDPEGKETKYAYDGIGNLIYIRNANGGEIHLEYDTANQLIKETNPLGQSRKYAYTADGDLASVTDEAGRTLKVEYICKGKPSHIFYADGKEETFTYDEAGNISSRSNKQGFTMTYAYDALNRLVEASGSNGECYSYTYDEVGNLTSASDCDGNTSRYSYDLNGKLVGVTDELGNRTEYEYDLLDMLIAINRIGEDEIHRTEYVRDAVGNVIRTIDPLGFMEELEYNTRGELTKKTDKDGYLTEYGYDLNGRLNSVRYNDGKEVLMSHDALGKLAEVRDWTGVTKVESDILGRVTKVVYPDERTAEYNYGRGGERTGIKHPDGRFVQYEYDDFLRLKSLKEADTEISYEYDDFGQLVCKSFASGLVSMYSYDNKGQLTELNSAFSGKVIESAKIRYDTNGNRISIERFREGIHEEDGLFTYRYDAAGRLTNVYKDGVLSRQYSYDAFGNRKSLASPEGRIEYHYDAMDRLLETTGEMTDSFKYDKRGNVIERISGTDSVRSYEYGAMNRLESARSDDGTAFYAYNGLGHRIEDRIRYGLEPERRISYTLDLTKYYNNLLERNTDGVSEAYIWDGLAVAVKGTHNCNYVCDDMGSPARLLDMDGSSADIYAYDEFGTYTYEKSDLQPLRYTGYRKDPIADMYFAQAREYMPEHGRMAGQDPLKGDIIHPYTLNPYIYAGDNPYIYYDPNGMWIHILVGAAVGAIVDGGFELGKQLVGQVTSGNGINLAEVNWGKVGTSALGGAVSGTVTAATGNPVAGAAAGGFVSGFTESKFVENKGWGESLLSGAIEGGVSAAFAKIGDVFKESSLGKRLKEFPINKRIDDFFKPYKDAYKLLLGESDSIAGWSFLKYSKPFYAVTGALMGGFYSKVSGLLKPMKWINTGVKGAIECMMSGTSYNSSVLSGAGGYGYTGGGGGGGGGGGR